MNRYFYLIHPFLPNIVALQVPVYIAAPDETTARTMAVSLCNVFRTQFDILFEPSDPVLVISSINEQSFDGLMLQLQNNNSVSVNLPFGHSFTLFQMRPYQQPLQTLQARVLVPGQHSPIYSL